VAGFEQGLVDFRSALRRGDPASALATAKKLDATVDHAAAVIAIGGGALEVGPLGWSIVAASAVVSLVLIWRWIGKRSLVG
jgi:hypothetical protein